MRERLHRILGDATDKPLVRDVRHARRAFLDDFELLEDEPQGRGERAGRLGNVEWAVRCVPWSNQRWNRATAVSGVESPEAALRATRRIDQSAKARKPPERRSPRWRHRTSNTRRRRLRRNSPG